MTSTADLVTESVGDLTAKNEKTFKEMSFGEKLGYIKEVITVEPLIAAYVMSSLLCGPALWNLEFEKSCRVNLAYNDTVCDEILTGSQNDWPEQNIQIQTLIANMHSWQSPLQTVMPLILILFLGSFSDRYKWRKPFLIVPLIGELFAVVGCILCVVFMKSWPLEAQGISQTVIPSFFGGQTMVVMASFAYIADVSTLEMRTLRIGIVQIVLNACTPFAHSFSGKLFEIIGYYGILLIAAGFYTFGILYGYFCIKEPRTPVKSKNGILRDIFDPTHAIDTLNLLVKKEKGNNRVYILLMMIIMFVFSGVNVGEGSVFFLYVQSVFSWLPTDFSYFITVNTLIHLFGTLAAVWLFTKVFQLDDLIILFLTFMDKIIANFIFGFANTATLLYVAAFVSVITGVSSIAIRSISTKIVAETDIGKANSLFGIVEAVAAAVATTIYSIGIYTPTIEVFPAMFFFFGVLVFLLCSVVIIGMYINDRRKEGSVAQEQQTSKEKAMQMEELQVTHI
ncbi:unnamed protein product [Brassicogethes aeneus]|uniref:Solute carrier family 46 member 3 n=1 Tax=Brassicogethes aeneus TaxID=1431903 RepID=A0A9P0FET4_BRAAE|nr:unnamed protein product [Brassicogethes aeneus]